MGSSTDGVSAEDSGSDAAEPPQRGLIGRLISAFATPEPPPQQPAPGNPTAPIGASGLPHVGNLRRLRVDDVAVPKADIEAVPLDIGLDDLVARFREHGYSRMPVYKGNLDHPQGLVHLKDLAMQHGFGATARLNLRRLIRPILFAAPSMPIGVLLQKMQKDRVHMALVIDEYGGVDGLVTIEDLIETVIGEIEDEHDEDEGALWKEEAAGRYIAQSNAPLLAFEAAIGRSLREEDEDDDIDTLGGLVFFRTGRIPAVGEVIAHEGTGVTYEILDADPRRIKKLRVSLPMPDADADAA
jgi:magnesium and cobalt transporter